MSTIKECHDLLVSGYINEISKLLIDNALNIIPIEIYQLCIHYYPNNKPIFIQHSYDDPFIFSIFDPMNKHISNKITVKLPEFKTFCKYDIKTKSLCFIENVSQKLINLPLDITKSLELDLENKVYDGFVGFIEEREELPFESYEGESDEYEIIKCYYTVFIFYESAFSNNINGTLLMSKIKSKVSQYFHISDLKIFDGGNSIFKATDYHDIYTLDLRDIRTTKFAFKKDTIKAMDRIQLPSESSDCRCNPELWQSKQFEMKGLQNIAFENIKYCHPNWICSNDNNSACFVSKYKPLIYNHKLGKIFTTWTDIIDNIWGSKTWFDESNPNVLYWMICFRKYDKKLYLYSLDLTKGYKWKKMYHLNNETIADVF